MVEALIDYRKNNGSFFCAGIGKCSNKLNHFLSVYEFSFGFHSNEIFIVAA